MNCTWTLLQYWSDQNVREVILQTKQRDGVNSYLCLQMACSNSVSANRCKKCFSLLWWARIQSQIQDHNWHPTRIPFTKQHASTWSRRAWVCSYFEIHHFVLYKSTLSCMRGTIKKIIILQKKQEGGSVLHMTNALRDRICLCMEPWNEVFDSLQQLPTFCWYLIQSPDGHFDAWSKAQCLTSWIGSTIAP